MQRNATTPPRKAITLRDVAERAGVSRTTASFVLNGRDDMRISEEAADRVRRAARELQYRPNALARALSTSTTRTLALLSDRVVTDGYATQLIEGCLQRAAERDHMLLIAEFQGDEGLRDRHLQDLAGRQVRGVLYAATTTTRIAVPPGLDRLPHVLVDAVAADAEAAAVSVLPDARQAGRTVVDHLVQAGHREGVWLVGEVLDDLPAALERRDGVLDALAAVGTSPAHHVDCRWWPDDAREATARALADLPAPRAVVCLNDRTALGVYQALGDAGLRIPDDVSVVSFDDDPMASWLRPALTTMAQPDRAMGRLAVDLLLDGAEGPAEHRVPIPLRRRGSVGPPAA